MRPHRGSIVLCIDEKPMQALFRRFPTRTVMIDGSLRREFEYRRHGTCNLLGALEVGTGRVVWDNLNIHSDGKSRRWTAFNRRRTPIHAPWVLAKF